PLGDTGQQLTRGTGGPAVDIAPHADRVPAVEGRPLVLDPEPEVLPPALRGFLPRHPDPVPRIAGHGGAGLGPPAHRHPDDLRELPAGHAAHHHVVVARVVGVPDDVDGAIRAAGHLRIPVVAGAAADAYGLRPLLAVAGGGGEPDVGGSVAEPLPGQPDRAL